MTDIDLIVVEPTGEKIFYRNRESITGVILPYDDTVSYGPEEYVNRFAVRGEYEISVKFYSDSSVELLGDPVLTSSVYSDYGKNTESVKTTPIRLEGEKEDIVIGKFVID